MARLYTRVMDAFLSADTRALEKKKKTHLVASFKTSTYYIVIKNQRATNLCSAKRGLRSTLLTVSPDTRMKSPRSKPFPEMCTEPFEDRVVKKSVKLRHLTVQVSHGVPEGQALLVADHGHVHAGQRSALPERVQEPFDLPDQGRAYA